MGEVMRPGYHSHNRSFLFFSIVVFAFLANVWPAFVSSVQAVIMADCEIEEGPGAGVVAARGWAFDTEPDVQISRVSLLVDGVPVSDLLCCSERQDVADTFPSFPVENTLNSGFGAVFNWGVLDEGEHTVTFEIQNTDGTLFNTVEKTITVIKPGDYEFISDMDLVGAAPSIRNNRLVLSGAVVTDSQTLAQQEVDLQFGWSSGAQQLGLTAANTIGPVASVTPSFFSHFASFDGWLDWSDRWAELWHEVTQVVTGYVAHAGKESSLYSSTVTPPTLSVSPITVGLADVAIAASKEDRFSIKNTGSGILEVTLTLTGSTDFSIYPITAFTLGTGQTRWITVTFSPTADGLAEAKVGISTNAGDSEVNVSGIGFTPSLTVSTKSIDFGQVETGVSGLSMFTLTNPGTDTVGSITVSSASAPFVLAVPDLSGGIAGGGGSADISVGFEPTTTGIFTVDILVSWQDGQSCTITIIGEGINPPLALTVPAFDLGDVEVGMTGMGTITITNPNTGTVMNISTADPGSEFTVTQPVDTELASGASTTFDLTFTPTVADTFNVSVVLSWTGGSTTVELTGKGVPAP